jgi:DNA-binding PadR family transcriptional regulator
MLDWNACPCSGGTLDRLIQPAILVVLTEGPLHGYRLAERISRMPSFQGHTPDVSGIYRFLKSMERKGFVESHWDLSASGPAKRSYRITPAGRHCLEKWIETLETYRKGIAGLLREARKVAQH